PFNASVTATLRRGLPDVRRTGSRYPHGELGLGRRQDWATSGWLARVNFQPDCLLAVQGEPPAVGKPVHEEQTEVLVPLPILDAPRFESERPSAVGHDDPQRILILLQA